jgi:hypothetical protein
VRLVGWSVLVSLSLAAPPALADVIPVDPSGGSIAKLQAAIDAASPGDILLLLPGTYTGFDALYLNGKGLTLVAAPGAQPYYRNLHVSQVPAGQTVVLRGIHFDAHILFADFYDGGALRASDCAGAIRVEDCLLTAKPFVIFGGLIPGMNGATVVNCAAVDFVRCELIAGPGVPAQMELSISCPATRGGYGAEVKGSTVSFHDCTLKGGSGGASMSKPVFQPGAEGGAGLSATSATVLLEGCQATGGQAGSLTQLPGNGLLVAGDTSAAYLRDSTVLAQTPLSGGIAAPDIQAPAGTVALLPAPARSVQVDASLHEMEVGNLLVEGQPGDLVVIFAGLQGGALVAPRKQGFFQLTDLNLQPLVVGLLPGSGAMQHEFRAPELPPGVPGLTVLLQLVVHDGSTALFEGGSTLVCLEAGAP